MSDRPRPLVAAAFLCDRVLTEQGGAQSYIRVVDVLKARTSDPEKPVRFGDNGTLWLVISLKSGDAKGKYGLRLQLTGPGTRRDLAEEMPFVMNGDEHGAIFNVQAVMDIAQSGLYWIDVIVDGGVVTRVPFTVRLERVPEQQSLSGSRTSASGPAL